MTQLLPLPEPTIDNYQWQIEGACRGMDSDVFFHPPGERRRRRAQRIEKAKAVCAGCPVIDECRRHALTAVEPYGVWGGLSEEERAERLGVPSLVYAARRADRAQSAGRVG